MRLAQNLYEAGAITYMRTDGVQMDHSAISAARQAISDRFSGHYLPEKPRIYQTKAKNAQEAHEAIRPTDFTRDRAGSGDEGKLYDLIFKRAMASQMAAAKLERTTVTLRDPTGRHELRATGQVVKFPGFLAVYEEGFDAKCRGRRREPAAADAQGRYPGQDRGRRQPAFHPAAAALFAKRAWSSGSRSSASAAPRPTPRRSRRCATANTCGWRRTASSPRNRVGC